VWQPPNLNRLRETVISDLQLQGVGPILQGSRLGWSPTLPGVGHAPMVDDPVLLARATVELLRIIDERHARRISPRWRSRDE
jgi:pimeloyl-ACP methyl ester carboxylesterase